MLSSVYNMAKQRCLAAANIIVVGDIYDKFVNAFVEGTKKLRIGYELDASVDMGPLASKKGKEKVLYYIQRGVEKGAKLILDGRF
ncbi:MAG TPA: aldehyde dehydrogenase family protein [Candidatus Korarchaeota archaeon]|nr:aldehyde dehydrogenase family protein [Candidatus Korarchaeota archaeon]